MTRVSTKTIHIVRHVYLTTITVLLIIIIIMAHPVIVDDKLGASPFFLFSLWLTVNSGDSKGDLGGP